MIWQLCSLLLSLVMGASLTSLTSLLFVGQILRFAPAPAIPSVVIVLVTVVFSAASARMQTRINHRHMEHSVRAIITGVQKIKLSGAEKRVFAKWLEMYAEGAALKYDPPMYLKLNTVISTAISLVSTIVLYVIAVRSRIDPSSYYAFTAAYGMLMGAFMSMSGMALTAAQIRPILEMAEPFLQSEPEMNGRREIVRQLSGSIELNHVSFRYDKASPYVLNDLSLKIGPGEYVAIVGRTGCGKSTLVRLLLGFEKPEKGTILYDGKNLESLDLPSLRKKIGTVMQDAGLFQGDIYSNIVITAPELTPAEAWEAAETAGIAEDIRAMPMGMHTIVEEGQGGISAGQRQRLMIARAIAPKPKLLIFDEATSALDNKTQRHISEALDGMGCTRLVIAHRLSTIRHCSRILVMDGGTIVEDGSYDELIRRGVVTGLSSGTTTLTATLLPSGRTAEITVTVSGASSGASSGGETEPPVPETPELPEIPELPAVCEVSLRKASGNGTVTISTETAIAGQRVSFTPSPAEGYEIGTVAVRDAGGNEIAVTDNGDGSYSFIAPAGGAVVEVGFIEKTPVSAPEMTFADVPADTWYSDAVAWASAKGITNGTDATHFSPDAPCTRAQMVTFLWRAAGEPEPESAEMPFADVESGSYYETAVRWAVQQGITKGMDETHFAPDATVTRAQTVTFLYRFAKAHTAAAKVFDDVALDAWYAEAVTWAAEKNITRGTGDTTFPPDDNCVRAQIVTFLYRYMGEG